MEKSRSNTYKVRNNMKKTLYNWQKLARLSNPGINVFGLLQLHAITRTSQSFGNSCSATTHSRKWTRPLRVLLSVQCSLQTSPITHPLVHYIHTVQMYMQHSPHVKAAARHDFFVKSLLYFSIILINADFDLVTKYILRKKNNISTDVVHMVIS